MYDFIIVGPKLTDKELQILDKFKEAKRIVRTVKPKSLLQWIKETGGIYDYGGELKAMGITSRTNPGLLRKNRTRESGQDDVALRAWEAGYFIGEERPTVNDLLDLIDREAGGEAVYSQFELDKFDEINYANNVFEEIDIMGYDIRNIEANSKKKTTKELLSKEVSEEPKLLSNDIKVKKLLIEKELELIKSKRSRLSERFEADRQIFRATFEEINDITDYTDEVVDSILANLKKEKYGNTYSDFTVAERGPLKRRALDFLEYDEIADFLNNDATEVVKNYARIMSTDSRC